MPQEEFDLQVNVNVRGGDNLKQLMDDLSDVQRRAARGGAQPPEVPSAGRPFISPMLMYTAFFSLIFGGLQEYANLLQTGRRPPGGGLLQAMAPAALSFGGILLGMPFGPLASIGLAMLGQASGIALTAYLEGRLRREEALRLYGPGLGVGVRGAERLAELIFGGGGPGRQARILQILGGTFGTSAIGGGQGFGLPLEEAAELTEVLKLRFGESKLEEISAEYAKYLSRPELRGFFRIRTKPEERKRRTPTPERIPHLATVAPSGSVYALQEYIPIDADREIPGSTRLGRMTPEWAALAAAVLAIGGPRALDVWAATYFPGGRRQRWLGRQLAPYIEAEIEYRRASYFGEVGVEWATQELKQTWTYQQGMQQIGKLAEQVAQLAKPMVQLMNQPLIPEFRRQAVRTEYLELIDQYYKSAMGIFTREAMPQFEIEKRQARFDVLAMGMTRERGFPLPPQAMRQGLARLESKLWQELLGYSRRIDDLIWSARVHPDMRTSKYYWDAMNEIHARMIDIQVDILKVQSMASEGWLEGLIAQMHGEPGEFRLGMISSFYTRSGAAARLANMGIYTGAYGGYSRGSVLSRAAASGGPLIAMRGPNVVSITVPIVVHAPGISVDSARRLSAFLQNRLTTASEETYRYFMQHNLGETPIPGRAG